MTVITLDLSRNYAEALLYHSKTFKPSSDDPREDMRLADALEDLAAAIEQYFAAQPPLLIARNKK
jgi:hypothetical protein